MSSNCKLGNNDGKNNQILLTFGKTLRSIQFSLCPYSQITNVYSNSSSSHFDNRSNEVDIGIDELLQQKNAINTMLLCIF